MVGTQLSSGLSQPAPLSRGSMCPGHRLKKQEAQPYTEPSLEKISLVKTRSEPRNSL